MGEKEGAVTSISGNLGGIVQVWVNVRGGMRIFAASFWHTVEWTPRNEAILETVLKRTRTTKASMDPRRFRKTFGFERSNARDSTRRSVNVQIKKCQRGMG